LALWEFYVRPDVEPASKEKMAYPLPDNPSIAVLPFVNMSGDPKQEYLRDGITESIITAVSKIHNLFVIARNSTFAYKGKAVNIQQVARELGSNMCSKAVCRGQWTGFASRPSSSQDDITMEILQAMRVKLTQGQQVLRVKRPKNIESAMKAYEAQGHVLVFTPEANDMGHKLAEEVIAMEPDWGEGYSINLGSIYTMLGRYEESVTQMKKAIALSPTSISAYSVLIVTYEAMGKEEARAAAAELLKINLKFSAEKYLQTLPYKDDAFPKLAAESFRKAGLLK
jgi:adenylate cyclase